MLKIKLFPSLIIHATLHENLWGSRSIVLPFLTLALSGIEWLTSLLCRFAPKEKAPSSHWIESWVGPRDSLDAVEKISCPAGNRTPATQPIVQRNSNGAIRRAPFVIQ
jgi:hypothetical protein